MKALAASPAPVLQKGMKGPLKLHLGCGKNTMADWINCDLTPGPKVDQVFDVQVSPWPFEDNSVGQIYASHMLEHLTDPFTFMKEAWRVLVPNGTMTLRLPYGGHRSAWWDLTHIRPWYPESFCMFQPGHAEATGNPQHEGWKWPLGIQHVDMRISGKFRNWLRWKPLRKFFLTYGQNFAEFTEEIWVYQVALKSAEAVAEYERKRPHFGNGVYTQWVMYHHQWEGRQRPDPGEQIKLVWLGDDKVIAAWDEVKK